MTVLYNLYRTLTTSSSCIRVCKHLQKVRRRGHNNSRRSGKHSGVRVRWMSGLQSIDGTAAEYLKPRPGHLRQPSQKELAVNHMLHDSNPRQRRDPEPPVLVSTPRLSSRLMGGRSLVS